MPITFYGRKFVNRGARNYLSVYEHHPAGYGATLSVKAASPGLSVYFVDDTQKTAASSVHFWSPSNAFTTIQVSADAPLGAASITFLLTPDVVAGKPALPQEEVTLTVTVQDSPFSAPLPPLAGLPAVQAPVTSPYAAALAQWRVNLAGPIRQIYSGPVDVSSEEGIWYYDGVDAALKIQRLTGDATWLPLATKVADSYLGSDPTKYGTRPGYEVFGQGLAHLYLAVKTQKYLDGLLALANHAAYGRENTISYSVTPQQLRETAYQLELELAIQEASPPDSLPSRVVDLADLLLLQLDQLFLTGSYGVCVSYWVGLAARALIHYLEQTPYKDARVLPYLQAAADGLWRDGWLPDPSGKGRDYFRYTYAVPGATNNLNPNPQQADATDLNLLIAPLFAWVYHMTGDTGYRDKGDAAFMSGVKGAYFDPSHGKQASQQIYFADRYAEWHDQPPVASPH